MAYFRRGAKDNKKKRPTQSALFKRKKFCRFTADKVEWIDYKDIEVLKVFHLSCPDRTELTRRLRKRALKDNRFDDANETVIQQRFATYEAETKPILDYYAGDRICPVDASQPPAKVLYDIIAGVMTLDAWRDIEKMKI